jgi:hypothetical protein
MKQHDLDVYPVTPRRKAKHERLINLLRAEGQCGTYRIMAALGIRDVSGCVTRANAVLAQTGRVIENLAEPGEVGRWQLGEDLTSPGREGR